MNVNEGPHGTSHRWTKVRQGKSGLKFHIHSKLIQYECELSAQNEIN